MKKGEKMSDEQKEKIRQGNLGRECSPETRKRLSDFFSANPVSFWLGKKRSEADRAKMSASHKGKILSAEHRQKLSVAHKNSERFKLAMEARSGENGPNWRGGLMKIPGRLWWLNHQYKIRKRKADGFHTLEEWETLKAQYNWTCPCCKRREPEVRLSEDHVIPLSKGGSDNIENIQPLCKSCNSRKHTKIIRYDA